MLLPFVVSIRVKCAKLGVNLNLEVVYTDFEKGIHSAKRQVFPSAVLKGCRFHLAQS